LGAPTGATLVADDLLAVEPETTVGGSGVTQVEDLPLVTDHDGERLGGLSPRPRSLARAFVVPRVAAAPFTLICRPP
jgi:hypothetical protein